MRAEQANPNEGPDKVLPEAANPASDLAVAEAEATMLRDSRSRTVTWTRTVTKAINVRTTRGQTPPSHTDKFARKY